MRIGHWANDSLYVVAGDSGSFLALYAGPSLTGATHFAFTPTGLNVHQDPSHPAAVVCCADLAGDASTNPPAICITLPHVR